MGQRIVITGANFAGAGLPKVLDDPILSPGTLALYDPTHSLGAFAGVPVNGQAIPNIAADRALAMVGAGGLADMQFKFFIARPQTDDLFLERSSKGGIHVLPSQVNQEIALIWAYLALPAALQTYLHAHIDDDLFFSAWWRLTRKQTANTTIASVVHKMSSTVNYLFHTENGKTPQPVGTSAVLGRRGTPDSNDANFSQAAGTPMLRNIGTTATTGAAFTLANNGEGYNDRGWQFGMGGISGYSNFQQNKAPGIILERAVIENLTVSGRSYAEVDAIDAALFAKAHAVGGRYYGDTWTDPATFP